MLARTLGNRHSQWRRMRVSSHYSGRKLPTPGLKGGRGALGHGVLSTAEPQNLRATHGQRLRGRNRPAGLFSALPGQACRPAGKTHPQSRYSGAQGACFTGHRTAFAKAKHHTLPPYPLHAACSPRPFHQRSGMHKGRCRPRSLTSQPGSHVLGQTLRFQPPEQFRCCQ